MRALKAEEVEFSLTIEDEDIPMDFDSGEPEKDEALKKELRDRLDRGDLWAWCCVKVTAKWKTWEGVDYLGGCSYDGEEDFKKDGHWEDMKDQALEDLNKKIASTAESLMELCEREAS
jgi:hypothetical protein